MTRSMFGWSLPPGVTHRMIEEQAGGDAGCAVCSKHVDHCVCQQCPTCGEHGNPWCYFDAELREHRENTQPPEEHRRHWNKQNKRPRPFAALMSLRREQKISRAKARIFDLREQIQAEELFIDQMKEQEYLEKGAATWTEEPTCVGCGETEEFCKCASFDSERK